MLWAGIDIYDVSCIDVSYMLGIGRSEQTVEKSHVTCCVKNYKKNKKNNHFVTYFVQKFRTLLNVPGWHSHI